MAGGEGPATGHAALTPKARARAILRSGTKRPAVSLFAPCAHALAARVESLSPYEFATSPQKLTNGVTALRESLEIDSVTVACGAGIEAEALGATADWTSGVPVMGGSIEAAALGGDDLEERLARGQRFATSLEAARRLAGARGEPLIVAGLTGPFALVRELRALGAPLATDDSEALATTGRIVLEEARAFLKAGCNAVVLVEPALDGAPAAWNDCVGTVVKLARFFEALPLLAYGAASPVAVPAGAIACPSVRAAARAGAGPVGSALVPDERAWAAAAGTVAASDVTVTLGDLRYEAGVADVRDACEHVRAACDPSGAPARRFEA